MKNRLRVQSEESDSQGMFEIEQNAYSNPRYPKNGDYNDRKQNKSKKKLIINPKIHDYARPSTYSSSSRLTSYLKGQSVHESQAPFKGSQSTYLRQITEKYTFAKESPHKVKEEMQLVLQRKVSEIEALRVHRDELKFISHNNPYDMPIKISLAILKEKAKAEQKMSDMTFLLQKDTKEMESEFTLLTQYYNYITNAIKSQGEDDLIIDTQEEEKLMIQNLQKQTNHLVRQLKEQDKKNAKQIRNIQQSINTLRVSIKQKQDKIRDLKSKICTMHIKLHSRVGSSSKQKSLSLSIRKFINQQNNCIQQAFVGNHNFKKYSKEVLEKVSENEQLTKVIFYFDRRKQQLIFRCLYKTLEGKWHHHDDMLEKPIEQQNKLIREKIAVQIKIKYLLSMKFFFKSKIVGVECRVKTDKGNQHLQIGNCSPNLEHELLTLINKNVVTLGSYWHRKEMIGVGIWYIVKSSDKNLKDQSQQKKKSFGVKHIKAIVSPRNNLKRQEYIQQDYYN